MKITIGEDGNLVYVHEGDKLLFNCPPDVAREIAHWLIHKANVVEQVQKVAQTIRDQAILERADTGIGITTDPKILDEAHKEAQWDRDLRRFMPLGGIEPKSIVGVPGLRKSNASKPN